MMFLTEVKMWDIVKKQFRFKLKSYRGVFTSLMVLQLIGMSFSLMSGDGMAGGGSDFLRYEMKFYTGNLVLGFMLFWAFISAILVTTQAYRYDDFSFITNRITSHFSNILFLAASSLIAAVTVFLSSYVIKLIVLLGKEQEWIISTPLTVGELLEGLFGTVLYIFLFTAIGYFTGMLIQVNKIFVLVLPALFFSVIFLDSFSWRSTLLPDLYDFFATETSLLLFTAKVAFVAATAYGAAILISNRMEVKR